MYAKRYSTETEYQAIQYYNGGSRVIAHDQHDWLDWLAEGGQPTIEAAGRFLSVVDGQLVVDPNKDAILFAEAKAAKINAVSNLRDTKIAAGIPFQFPDGPGTVQTRDERDFRNIQGVSTTGIVLAGQSTSIPFRDMENVTHQLTPAEAVQMGMTIAAAVAAIYAVSWSHKDAIEALTTIEDVNAYDIETGW